MRVRYISLYYGSIGLQEVRCLFVAWVMALFINPFKRRQALANIVERCFPKSTGAFSYSSARGALAACLKAAGVKPGDHVLLSSYTCLAVPTAVLAVGAKPIYLDIDPLKLHIPVEKIISGMGKNVRAVIIQHTLGCIAEVQQVIHAASDRGIIVLEDCALSIGSRRQGIPIGSFGDAAIFSMELSKTISSGWGGVLVINNPTLARQVEKDYAKVPEPGYWKTARKVWQTILSGIFYDSRIFPVGRYCLAAAFRYGIFMPSTPPEEIKGFPRKDFIERLSGSQAVLAKRQWQRLDKITAICQQNVAWLRKAITKAGFCILGVSHSDDNIVAPRVAFIVANRERFLQWFAAKELEVGLWFDGPLSPLPSQSIFNFEIKNYPNAQIIAQHVVNFASHSKLRKNDLNRLALLLQDYAQAYPDERAFARQFVSSNRSQTNDA